MRFYKPAERQPCYYCERISAVEKEQGYPTRDGIYTFEKYIFRCAWHSRFSCSRCGNQHHFSWLYWCPQKEELVCGDCNKPTLKPVAFWDRTYAYEFYCEECGEHHVDLFYAEFQGQHPWQLGHQTVRSCIDAQKPWTPIWSPTKQRAGIKLELVEALKLPSRVLQLREDLKITQFKVLRSAVPDEEIDLPEARESWETNTEQWTQLTEGDLNRQLIIDPALWSLLGDVKDLHVLDAGCGNGYFTRKLASKGANAVGVDYSRPFIKYCKRVESELNLGCDFYEMSLTDMNNFESKMFDIVISNVVMVDVLDYKTAFKEIARVLKDDGRFIWSNVHPVFGRTAGAIDPRLPRDSPRNEERYLKMIDRYFDSGGERIDWMENPTWQFMRTLEEYSKALKSAGFVISEILEPRPTPEVIQQNPRHLSFDADRWTHFIIFECIKRH
ncbi:MAG: class I SAM-dependent methyltransferase [Candidatus Thorarchaeota archaeon]|nr:class I SAM-dependent methyltransferase [Candidatus Thorarchaeota archaeon]